MGDVGPLTGTHAASDRFSAEKRPEARGECSIDLFDKVTPLSEDCFAHTNTSKTTCVTVKLLS
jgi:hypothetical protein